MVRGECDMRGKMVKAVQGALFALMLGACGPVEVADPAESGQSAQAVLSSPGNPAFLGPLPVGGAVQTQFTTQPQAFSFAFQVRAGAQVKLEVTHLGSSMGLDTGLFVYGPRDATGGYGSTAIAQDDDSGYGQLSKIASLSLPAGGEYLAVVSSGTGAGKRFRLQLDCLNGACAPAVRYDACDLDVATRIEVCVQARVEEPDPVLGRPYTAAEAYAACTDSAQAHAAFTAECGADTTKAWCAGGEPAFTQGMWPLCQDFYRAYYDVGPLKLGALEVSDPLQEALSAGNTHCHTGENWCDGLLATYTVPGVATVPQSLYKVADAALDTALGEAADHYRFERLADLTYAELSQRTQSFFPELLQALPAELGNGTETPLVAHYNASYPVAPGAKDYHHVYVVLFPESYRVAVFQVVYHEI
jgi:hypothetical protein